MTTSQFLSIDYAGSCNMLQTSVFSLTRRRSFGELKKSLSPKMQRRLTNLCDVKKKWKSGEILKPNPDPVVQIQEIKGRKQKKEKGKVAEEEKGVKQERKKEEVDEDIIGEDEDAKMFLEYQRCAMASRRRKSFNDVGELQTPLSTKSVNITIPEISVESLSILPSSTPCILIEPTSDDENTDVLSTNSGWNRLKRMFTENKLKEQSANYLTKPAMYNVMRRGSCDSQLQSLHSNKLLLSERSRIPEVIFSSYLDDNLDKGEGSQPSSTKADGWARFKKRFKEGMLKPMPDESCSNDKVTHDNVQTSKVDSTSYKPSGITTKKGRKSAKTDIIAANVLHNAIIEGDLILVKKIIESEKVDINFLKPPGLTPLHVACAFGNFKIIELLISNGADVKIKTWSRISPLQVSTLFGHFEVCQYLISNGANSVDVQDGFVHDLKLMSSVLLR